MNPQDQLPQSPTQSVSSQQTYGPPTMNTFNVPVAASPKPDVGSRKTLYILIGSGAGLLVIIVLAVVLSSGSSAKKTTSNAPNTQQVSGPVPATSLTLQQDSDAINQNLSSLNDVTDFPVGALSDTSLSN